MVGGTRQGPAGMLSVAVRRWAGLGQDPAGMLPVRCGAVRCGAVPTWQGSRGPPVWFGAMLEMSARMHAAMVAHAIAGLPHEACGLFAGQPGSDRIERFFPMRNAAESREIYVLDGLEMMDVERTADDAGLTVMGVMHSHTHTTNYPSPTDIADAARFDPFGAWRFIIVSLRHPEPSLRSYRILDGNVDEEPVVVDGSN